MQQKKIGEILIDEGLITQEILEQVLEDQKKRPHMKFGEILLDLKLVDYDKFIEFLNNHFNNITAIPGEDGKSTFK